MRNIYIFVLCVLVTLPALISAQDVASTEYQNKYEPNKIFVRLKKEFSIDLTYNERSGFKSSVSKKNFEKIFENNQVKESSKTFQKLKYNSLKDIYTIYIADESYIDSLLKELSKSQLILYAERVPKYEYFYTPNDFYYSTDQLYLQVLEADSAWDITKGDPIVKIAIVDDAVQIDHEDLSSKIWINTGEIPNDSIDNDLNGYVDDYLGYDVADQDGDVSPDNIAFFSHGTMVAGAAAAESDNLQGVASIGYNCSIIPVKCKESGSNGNYLTDPFLGIEYAIVAGADVINMSWGGSVFSQTYDSLCSAAHNNGIVLVAAAGNSGTNMFFYPASYNGVISVGATDINDYVTMFSTFNDSIDVMAPGMSVFTTIADTATGHYGNASGTSISAPLVSAICALQKANNPAITPDEIEMCLKLGSRNIYKKNPSYVGKIGAGRVDVYNALLCIETPPPLITPHCSGSSYGIFVCKNGYAQFNAAHFVQNINTIHWYFPGGSPQQATTTTVNVQYNYPGVFDVILVYCDNSGLCDSLVYNNYVHVGGFNATLFGNNGGIVCKNEPTYLNVQFNSGYPPYSIAFTDGITIDTITGINDELFSIMVNPQNTTTYSVFWARDLYCETFMSSTITLIPYPCNPCTNIDFELGNFTTWYGEYGYCCGSTNFSNGIYPNRQKIISQQGFDPHSFNSVKMIDTTDGGTHSVRLGNWWVNKESEKLLKNIKVLPSNSLLTFKYAVFLQDPFGHSPLLKPKFSVKVLDSTGILIPGACSHYEVTAGNATSGWQYNNLVRYHDWQSTTIDLSQYLNNKLTLEFKTEDCGHGGHFGYAYIDAECFPSQVSLINYCDTAGFITLSAPPGFSQYFWIPTGDTTQSITLINYNIGDTISVSMLNSNGCATTINHVINLIPVPQPSVLFNDTTICLQDTVMIVGVSSESLTHFSWTSVPPGFISSNDTIYVSPADTTIYNLQISNNYGCMADTIVSVRVNISSGLYSDITAHYYICSGDSITLQGQSLQGQNLIYSWTSYPPLFSDTGSVITVSPQNSMIYILETSNGICNFKDSVFVSQYAYSYNSPITHAYLCENETSVVLTAPANVTNILWPLTGDTTNSIIIINPTLFDIYSVHFTSVNGCQDSAFFIIDYIANPIALAGSDTSICEGMSLILYGSGSQSPDAVYEWTSIPTGINQTGDSILVFPDVTTKYILKVSNGTTCPGVADYDTVTVSVTPAPVFDLGSDFYICKGNQVSLSQSEVSGVHFWNSSPDGFFGQDSVAVVAPQVTTTYYLTVYTGYCMFSDSVKVIIADSTITLPDTFVTHFCKIDDSLYVISAENGFLSYYWPAYDTSGQSIYVSQIQSGDLFAVVVTSAGELCPDILIVKAIDAFNNDSIKANISTSTLCEGDYVTLAVENASSLNNFSWASVIGTDTINIGTGNNLNYIPSASDSLFIVYASNNYCIFSDTVKLHVFTQPEFFFQNDTIICYGDSMVLDPQIKNYTSYLWSDTISDTIRYITESANYLLTVFNGPCSYQEEINIEVLPAAPDFWVPNVITPNGDGFNDKLIIPIQLPEKYNLIIYNRWGVKIYESDNGYDYWNGTFNGKKLDDGTYFYLINYKSACSEKEINENGSITIVDGN